jgi:hypothetical protein
MAEEGTPSEGQESGTEGQPSTESIAQLSSLHISTYEEMKAEDTSRSQLGTMGWAEAVSKDERQERIHNRHGAGQSTTHRSRGSIRAQWRAQKDWQRTVRGIRRQYWYTPPSVPREPYAKGSEQHFWAWVWEKLQALTRW